MPRQRRMRTAPRYLRALALASAWLSCSGGSHDGKKVASAPMVSARPASGIAPASVVPSISLNELDDLFGIPIAERDAAAWTGNDVETYRRWLKARLTKKQPFELLTSVITNSVHGDAGPITSVRALREGESRSRGKFLYRVTPCPESELVRVAPWWDAGSTVLVCSKDYLPDQMTARDGQSCDEATNPLRIDQGCGCGPFLMFCSSDELADKLEASKMEEIALTMKHLVEGGRPFGEIFTIDDTVRSGIADLFYARLQFFLDGKFVPPDVAAPATLRPRPEVTRSGILTTQHYLFGDDRRRVVYDMWEDFLCIKLTGKGVETKALLGAFTDHAELRAQTNMRLANSIGCQNCHATLENTQVAYGGWQDTATGQHYDPKLSRGDKARLFVRGHDDLRAEGPATLEWLGSTMAQLPEFNQCIVSKVSGMVYEGQTVPADVKAELQRKFNEKQDMAALLEGAVLARAFGPQVLRGGHPPVEAHR